VLKCKKKSTVAPWTVSNRVGVPTRCPLGANADLQASLHLHPLRTN